MLLIPPPFVSEVTAKLSKLAFYGKGNQTGTNVSEPICSDGAKTRCMAAPIDVLTIIRQ